jgi:aubergine-like protein
MGCKMRQLSVWLQEVEHMVCLVPELCYLTGLTDEMKNDFRVMKNIAMYTRITPNQRQAALKKFISNIEGMRAYLVAE